MIKKYLEFLSYIKENNNTEIEDLYLSDKYIKDFFLELEIDNSFLIDITKGILFEREIYGKNKIDFYKYIPSGKCKLAYEIFIECPSKFNSVNDIDLTDEFITSILRLSDYTDMDFYIKTDDYKNEKVNLDDIEVSTQSFIFKDKMHPYSKSILLYLYEKEFREITDVQVANYYEWEYDYIDDKGNIYIEYDFEELLNLFLSEKDSYYKMLTNPESIYDHYWSGDYIPDLDSLFSYYLDKENSSKLISKLIEFNGGYKDVISILDDNEYTEDQVVNFLTKNPSKLQYLNDINLLEEIQDLCANYLYDAHIEENMKELKSSFFNKLKKEVKLSIDKNSKDETVYKIKFNSEWYLDLDYDLKDTFKHISDIMYEWIYKNDITFTTDPYFSDYGDFNQIEFNKEVKGILNQLSIK